MNPCPRLALAAIALLTLCLGLSACAKRDGAGGATASAPAAADPASQSPPENPFTGERKLIKTAELGLRVKSPPRALEEARTIAQQFGGLVVSSSAEAPREPDGEASVVRISLKVKAERFDDALGALRRLGHGSGTETVSVRDVSEEAADLDARLRTQKRMEEQFLTILKEARSVPDALSVHKELAQVRGEIERLEGRQKLLENQVALSTINLRFEQDEPLVALSGGRFGRALKHAGVDVLNVGAAIVIGAIRLAGVLVPVLLLILLPLGFGLRWTLRRLISGPRVSAAS
jgi:hypothetical protein